MVRPIWDAGTALKIIGVNGSVVPLFIWKRACDPIHRQWDTVFSAFMCLWDGGAWYGLILLAETLEFTWGIPSALGSGILALLTGAVVLERDKTREKQRSAFCHWHQESIFIFPAGAFIMRRPHTRCIFRIFRSAFGIRQISGGIAGFSISKSLRYGISRGVFSNEAGLGTLAVLHGPAEHTTPWEQGMWAMFEVFFLTVVLCCRLTALVILLMHQGDMEVFSYWSGFRLLPAFLPIRDSG